MRLLNFRRLLWIYEINAQSSSGFRSGERDGGGGGGGQSRSRWHYLASTWQSLEGNWTGGRTERDIDRSGGGGLECYLMGTRKNVLNRSGGGGGSGFIRYV